MIETNEQKVDKEVLFQGAKDFLAALEFIKAHKDSTYLKFANNTANSSMSIKKEGKTN